MQIPRQSLDRRHIFETLEAYRADDLKWREGRSFGLVFDAGPEVMDIGKEAYNAFLTENAMDFTAFRSLIRIENELVAMTAAHLGGDERVVGNFTSGGTESIILAVKTARDYFRKCRPDVTSPEMVLPTSAHAAFHKAAHYLDVKVVPAAVDPATFRADVDQVRRAITPNTIMLVGSAPSYAHGVVDPIRDLAQLALERDLWFHTDACMGGFMLPYFRRLGEPVPAFDFSVPGVSSISADLHKYAYSPKGASLILYRDKSLRKHQIFACSQWIGYTIINNAVQSSKSGGPMAAAWAVLNFVGDEGYLKIARNKLAATKKICAGIERINGLKLLARPDMCLVSFTSDDTNIFHIIDEMNARGWYVQPALSFDNSPAHIHLSINASNVEWVDRFLADLEASVAVARDLPPGQLARIVREDLAHLDFSSLTDDDLAGVLSMAGLGGGGLPRRMAEINEALDVLPPETRNRILIAFVNDLFTSSSG
jgi:glutamate/tyrosine decarboxylase-like PLP-dependent enzyme